ncbi:hypothetical protein ACLB1Q_35760 [Escherichia coli]
MHANGASAVAGNDGLGLPTSVVGAAGTRTGEQSGVAKCSAPVAPASHVVVVVGPPLLPAPGSTGSVAGDNHKCGMLNCPGTNSQSFFNQVPGKNLRCRGQGVKPWSDRPCRKG